jgi:hypothetical protein
MDREPGSHIGTTIDAGNSPEGKWIIWAIWSGISLAAVLFAVLVLGVDTGLLLGWAVGIIIPAAKMVFRR